MRLLMCMTSAGVLVLAGCQAKEQVWTRAEQRELRVSMVKMVNNTAIDNAIISQRTVYPYHFATEAAALNDLGRRDLDVLAGHFREHPGTLNVRQGSASDELYAGRVNEVRDYMIAAGVSAGRITIAADLPGGSGLASEDVITILESERAAGPGGGDSESRETSMGTEGGGYAGPTQR